jgi:hypothetical protein
MALKPGEVAALEADDATAQAQLDFDAGAEAVPAGSEAAAAEAPRAQQLQVRSVSPVMARLGQKWSQLTRSGRDTRSQPAAPEAPAAALSTEAWPPPPPGPAKLTGRDATVAVINRWTRNLWEVGKRLERRFEDYLVEQEAYEEQLLEATETFHGAQQALLALPMAVDDATLLSAAASTHAVSATEGASPLAGAAAAAAAAAAGSASAAASPEGSSSSSGGVDAATSEAALSLAEAAAATTALMRHEPAPTIVTGFIDTGSTNCFAGAYELKIRLEHVEERLQLLLDTVDALGHGTDDEGDAPEAVSDAEPAEAAA